MRKLKPKAVKYFKVALIGGPFNGQQLAMSDEATLVFRIKGGKFGYYKRGDTYFKTANWITC